MRRQHPWSSGALGAPAAMAAYRVHTLEVVVGVPVLALLHTAEVRIHLRVQPWLGGPCSFVPMSIHHHDIADWHDFDRFGWPEEFQAM